METRREDLIYVIILMKRIIEEVSKRLKLNLRFNDGVKRNKSRNATCREAKLY